MPTKIDLVRCYRLGCCATLLVLALAHPAMAQVYLGWDAEGVPVFSDRPQPSFTLFLPGDDLPVTSPARRQTRAALNSGMQRYANEIARIAHEFALAPELLHAVIQVESGYDPHAVSAKGAVGLMQLMPATAQRYGVADRRDARANLRGGARYLRDLLALFGGDLTLALAAYNAGEASVIRHANRIPPFPETMAYVRAVLRRYEHLRSPASVLARH